jgi:hypothetical protein
VPRYFCLSTANPITKGRNVKITDSSNYRGIVLCTIFRRIFDLIIITRYHDKLQSNNLQFGFKPHRSTVLCTMIVKETIAYYTNNNSNVYCVFLDATKAFDKVEYCRLFKLLLSRNIPAFIVRLLLNMYIGQLARIAWNGNFSDSFGVSNGVKQGGIISPTLFCLYIICIIRAAEGYWCRVGCYIGLWGRLP